MSQIIAQAHDLDLLTLKSLYHIFSDSATHYLISTHCEAVYIMGCTHARAYIHGVLIRVGRGLPVFYYGNQIHIF